MTRLLVSVRSAAEAALACSAGVDLVDVKEPAAGSLGAADGHVLAEIARTVAGRATLSAALGELRDCGRAPQAELPDEYSYAKLGLASCAKSPNWQRRWEQTLADRAPYAQRVAVCYADFAAAEAPPPEEVLQLLPHAAALLIDTFDKRHGSLLKLWDRAMLADVVAAARSAGRLVVLAGSLRLEDLDQALELAPDYVAVRGAVCRGSRQGELDPLRLSQFLHRLRAADGLRRVS